MSTSNSSSSSTANGNQVTIINQVGGRRRSPLSSCLSLIIGFSLVVAFFTWPLYTWHGVIAGVAEFAWIIVAAVFLVAVLSRTGRRL